MFKERDFQREVIRDIKTMFPDCIVIKTDPNYIQGFPDLLILYQDKWACLEVKRSITARHQPNQDYYIDIFEKMSFASFIYPENKKEVLNELQRTFERY